MLKSVIKTFVRTENEIEKSKWNENVEMNVKRMKINKD